MNEVRTYDMTPLGIRCRLCGCVSQDAFCRPCHLNHEEDTARLQYSYWANRQSYAHAVLFVMNVVIAVFNLATGNWTFLVGVAAGVVSHHFFMERWRGGMAYRAYRARMERINGQKI